MKIDVEVTATEKIKPSSPTPDHFRHYKFSFLDQLAPTFYIPLIYFYSSLDETLRKTDISSRLKISLSKILACYYPLAGCIRDNSVECNDEGVLFLDAQVNCQLSQVIELPSEFNKFLPYGLKQDGILAIQINVFSCGSIAIDVLVWHKIADGSSMITFIKNWAVTSRGESANFCPQFASATLFPPKVVGGLTVPGEVPTEKNAVLKRFVFSGSMLAALREKYADRTCLDNGIYPTRVEALSSFIWSRFVASTQVKVGIQQPYMLIHAVNFRRRMYEALPDDSFGNLAMGSIANISGDYGEKCCGLVTKFRDAISKINKDYVTKLQNGVFEEFGLWESKDERMEKGEEVVKFCFTSLCRFPVYEADFGWGRPQWVAWGGLTYCYIVVLMDTKCGDGIEAWVHLKDEDMSKFETDIELLSFVSPASCE